MEEQQIAQRVADFAQGTQYTASAATVVLSFINEFAAALGFFIAVCGLIVGWYYKHKAHKLLVKSYEKECIKEE